MVGVTNPADELRIGWLESLNTGCVFTDAGGKTDGKFNACRTGLLSTTFACGIVHVPNPTRGGEIGVRVLEGGDAIPGMLDFDDVRIWLLPSGDGVAGLESEVNEVGEMGGGRGGGSADVDELPLGPENASKSLKILEGFDALGCCKTGACARDVRRGGGARGGGSLLGKFNVAGEDTIAVNALNWSSSSISSSWLGTMSERNSMSSVDSAMELLGLDELRRELLAAREKRLKKRDTADGAAVGAGGEAILGSGAG